ncbi:hypothetical protein BDN72DRAFT_502472 [Pluteus cervinus]|uniref:Uncharacterized protein n=1 Tax=Pluteus cervinus TaxID=181527 RepID=A0ACD3AYU0_9AGAR|nr:hypothetical protein BDN72DRAFT_502472 [Pluteus cervinus]
MGDIPPTGQLPVWRAGRPPSNSNRTANPTQPRDPQSVLVQQQFGRQNQHSGPQAYQSAPSPGRANIPINTFSQVSFRNGHPNPGPRGRANTRGHTSVFNPRSSGAAFRADSQNPQYSAFSPTQSRKNVPSPPRHARQSNPASPRVPQGLPPRHPQTGQAPRINNPLVTSTSPFQQRTSHTTPSSRQHGHVTRLTPTTPMKTTGPVKPRWQSEDEAYEAIRGSKRTRDDSGGNRRISALDSVRRVSSISAVSRRRAFNVNPQANENRPKTHVLPVFKVRVEGQPAPESDEDDDLDVPVRRPQKRVGLGHTGTAEGSREG